MVLVTTAMLASPWPGQLGVLCVLNKCICVCVCYIDYISLYPLFNVYFCKWYLLQSGWIWYSEVTRLIPSPPTHISRDTKEEREREREREMPMHCIVLLVILKASFICRCLDCTCSPLLVPVVEGSGSSTDGEYTGAEWTEGEWTTIIRCVLHHYGFYTFSVRRLSEYLLLFLCLCIEFNTPQIQNLAVCCAVSFEECLSCMDMCG